MRKLPLLVAVAVGLVFPLLAQATTAGKVLIDFDELDGEESPAFGTVTSNGFTFSSEHAHVIGEPDICLFDGCQSNGSPAYVAEEAGGGGRLITMTQTGGGTFDLKSFTAGQMFNNDVVAAAVGFPNSLNIFVVGTTAAGEQYPRPSPWLTWRSSRSKRIASRSSCPSPGSETPATIRAP